MPTIHAAILGLIEQYTVKVNKLIIRVNLIFIILHKL